MSNPFNAEIGQQVLSTDIRSTDIRTTSVFTAHRPTKSEHIMAMNEALQHNGNLIMLLNSMVWTLKNQKYDDQQLRNEARKILEKQAQGNPYFDTLLDIVIEALEKAKTGESSVIIAHN